MELEYLVNKLQLKPHPEGGFYRETYRSEGVIDSKSLNSDISGPRNYCTSIYFLLTAENFSAFHRIKQDELWHFYVGSPITIHEINDAGIHTVHHLGLDLENGQVPQLTIPAHSWFSSSVSTKGTFALAGCTVSPGFDFEDFEMADRARLIHSFPQHRDIIQRFTR